MNSKGGRVTYMLNGFEENLNYILDSTNAVEVAREGSKENGDLVIYFETKDDDFAKGGIINSYTAKGNDDEKIIYKIVKQKNKSGLDYIIQVEYPMDKKRVKQSIGEFDNKQDALDFFIPLLIGHSKAEIGYLPRYSRSSFARGGMIENILKTGGEYDLSNQQHPTLPNRAIRYNTNNDRYEIFNYMTDEVDYSDRNLEDILTKSNRMFDTNFARGGMMKDDTPKIYVADLKAYNEGRLIGEFIDLSEYDSGEEVMEKITELMEEYSDKYHNGEETEYAIHDYENFSSSLYSESMGEEDFDIIIDTYKMSDEYDIPAEVLQDVMNDFNSANENLSDFISDRYYGRFDNESALAYDYVEQMGGISELGDNTIETYFDYDSFGRDLAMDFSEYDGYYFRAYKKGGKIPKYDMKKYMKKGGMIPLGDMIVLESIGTAVCPKSGMTYAILKDGKNVDPDTETEIDEIDVTNFEGTNITNEDLFQFLKVQKMFS